MLYTGFTSNLEQRIAQHNSGKNKSTAYRQPLICIFAEYFLFELDARNRESYFKTLYGIKGNQVNAALHIDKTWLQSRFNAIVEN